MSKQAKILIAILSAALVLAFAGLFVRRYNKTHMNIELEVVRSPYGKSSVLAVSPEGMLVAFIPPKEETISELQPGTLIRVTGPDYIMDGKPMRYPNVKKVKIIGSRPNFEELYFDDLIHEYMQKGRQVVKDVEDLTPAEKVALTYLFDLQLGKAY